MRGILQSFLINCFFALAVKNQPSSVSFINFYSYNNPQVCLELYNKLPNLRFISVETINEKNYANVIDAFSIIYGLLDTTDERKNSIKKLICNIAKRLEESTDSYAIRSVLKAYNKIGMFKEADNFTISQTIENDIWILLWRAKAKIELHDKHSLELINTAINQEIPSTYKSTFYQCQAKAYIVNNDSNNAKHSLEEAIKSCTNQKFKIELEKELKCL